jgi:hypothetical protein
MVRYLVKHRENVNLYDCESNIASSYRYNVAGILRGYDTSVLNHSGSRHGFLSGTAASASIKHQLHTDRRGNGIMDR